MFKQMAAFIYNVFKSFVYLPPLPCREFKRLKIHEEKRRGGKEERDIINIIPLQVHNTHPDRKPPPRRYPSDTPCLRPAKHQRDQHALTLQRPPILKHLDATAAKLPPGHEAAGSDSVSRPAQATLLETATELATELSEDRRLGLAKGAGPRGCILGQPAVRLLLLDVSLHSGDSLVGRRVASSGGVVDSGLQEDGVWVGR